MEITGKLLKKSDIRQPSETFTVQEFYLDCSRYDQITGQKRENVLKFQVTGSKIDTVLSKVNNGDLVNVFFNVKGRFWEKETEGEIKKGHSQSLDAWRIDVKQPSNGEIIEYDDDDLPF
ncbi:DUF3127 domain-containing protein [Riemerella anatipestifer]|uniref:DUF3127 domain-containing protein n=1 Tax=Riemerella anatipestifer TaxID=34085 RepID=UPI00129ED41C|nr:DUF3127 domain-containing protein [Riemerella anatipestifer]MRN00201.1 DUF3127 domain-containing protein [Riemerella anatipestifer]MRN02085.1 DUF3127 domain-containing protein [Riemerella anatipestifer]